jgi:hypothetical protein
MGVSALNRRLLCILGMDQLLNCCQQKTLIRFLGPVQNSPENAPGLDVKLYNRYI